MGTLYATLKIFTMKLRKHTNLTLTLLGLISGMSVSALPRPDAVPGGVMVVPISSSASAAPQVYYDSKRTMVIEDGEHWYAVLGLSLGHQPGSHTLELRGTDGKRSFASFTVAEKQYTEEHITLKDNRMVNPYAADLVRIRDDQRRIRKAFTNWREAKSIDTGFVLPVTGSLSSPFGKRRFFNGKPRSPHSGIDIAAPTGTAVVAPGDGVVTEKGDYFFNGKTVFLDHGQGLVTMYCHLNSISVEVGQVITKGEKIAEVGTTGRSTGPHLHWGVSLNNARVNPLLFLTGKDLAQIIPGSPSPP